MCIVNVNADWNSWSSGYKQTYLPLETAAVQVVVFSLETFGFSQDGFNLKVDHIGHLMGGHRTGLLDCRNTVMSRWCYRAMNRTWVWAAVMETSLNIFLLLECVLNIFTACWAASWTSDESGFLSNQPPRRDTFSGFNTDKDFRVS